MIEVPSKLINFAAAPMHECQPSAQPFSGDTCCRATMIDLSSMLKIATITRVNYASMRLSILVNAQPYINLAISPRRQRGRDGRCVAPSLSFPLARVRLAFIPSLFLSLYSLTRCPTCDDRRSPPSGREAASPDDLSQCAAEKRRCIASHFAASPAAMHRNGAD